MSNVFVVEKYGDRNNGDGVGMGTSSCPHVALIGTALLVTLPDI